MIRQSRQNSHYLKIRSREDSVGQIIIVHQLFQIDFQGSTVFEIAVRDGDTGKPRKLELKIVGDTQNFFTLDVKGHDEKGVLTASLKKSEETILDREIEV